MCYFESTRDLLWNTILTRVEVFYICESKRSGLYANIGMGADCEKSECHFLERFYQNWWDNYLYSYLKTLKVAVNLVRMRKERKKLNIWFQYLCKDMHILVTTILKDLSPWGVIRRTRNHYETLTYTYKLWIWYPYILRVSTWHGYVRTWPPRSGA